MGEEGAELSRRLVLGGSVALVLSACEPLGYREPEPITDPDVLALRRAIADEEVILARYKRAIRAHADLAGRLRPVAAEHAQHLRALRSRWRPTPAPSPSPSRIRSGTKKGRSARQPIAALADYERRYATALTRELGPLSPALAQLLASIAAAETVHATLLAEES